MRCLRHWLVDCSLKAILGLFLTLPAYSQTETTPVDLKRDKFIGEYLRIAFSEQRQVLRKFANSIIPTELTCDGLSNADCSEAKDVMAKSILYGFGLDFDFHTKPILHFEFVQPSAVEARSVAARKEFEGGFQDTSDPICEAFYSMNGSEITSARLIVAARQQSLRARLCILIQLAKAMGLNGFGDETFAEQWVHKPVGLQDATEDDFKHSLKQYASIEIVHACPELKPGMTLGEAKKALLTSECFAKYLHQKS